MSSKRSTIEVKMRQWSLVLVSMVLAICHDPINALGLLPKPTHRWTPTITLPIVPLAMPVQSTVFGGSPVIPTGSKIQGKDGIVSFTWGGETGEEQAMVLLEGLDNSAVVEEVPETGGAFVSFAFKTSACQHDAVLGRLPPQARLLAHSRIKRWWMAPSFPAHTDDVPVETQLLLLEIPATAQRQKGNRRHNTTARSLIYPDDSQGGQGLGSQSGLIEWEDSTITTIDDHDITPEEEKQYAVIAPLIDFDHGFRATLFGGKQGGAPAGR